MNRDIDNVAVHSRWPLTTGVAQGRYYCTLIGEINTFTNNLGGVHGHMAAEAPFGYAIACLPHLMRLASQRGVSEPISQLAVSYESDIACYGPAYLTVLGRYLTVVETCL